MLTHLNQFHYFSGQVWSILEQTAAYSNLSGFSHTYRAFWVCLSSRATLTFYAVRSKNIPCSSPSSTWSWDLAHSSSVFSFILVLEENWAYKSAARPELPHPHPWAGQPGATRQAMISWDAEWCVSTPWLSNTCVTEIIETRAQRLWDLSLRIYQLLSLLMFWAIWRVMSMVRTCWSGQELIN